MNIKKVFACILCAVVCITFMCGISINAQGTYRNFDVTDTSIRANTKLELNFINDGLRQAINDTVCNYQGCTVKFMTNAPKGTKARFTANGMPFLSDTVTSDNGYFTFSFDKLNTDYDKWGLITDLSFSASTDLTIYTISVYVPPQDSPVFSDLSAGECAYETANLL